MSMYKNMFVATKYKALFYVTSIVLFCCPRFLGEPLVRNTHALGSIQDVSSISGSHFASCSTMCRASTCHGGTCTDNIPVPHDYISHPEHKKHNTRWTPCFLCGLVIVIIFSRLAEARTTSCFPVLVDFLKAHVAVAFQELPSFFFVHCDLCLLFV
jgi:hypothetical protein